MLLLVPTALALDLSYEDALDRALEGNPSLMRAEASVDLAEASVYSAKAPFDPTVQASVGRQYQLDKGVSSGFPYESTGTRWTWGASVNQTLPTGTTWSLDWSNYSSATDYTFFLADVEQTQSFQLGQTTMTASVTQQLLKGYRMAYNLQPVVTARSALTQAEAALLQERQDTLAAVATAYWDLVYARQALALARDAVQVAKEELRIVEAQLEAGNMAPVERTRVQAAVAQTELTLLEAEAAEQAANEALCVLLGVPFTEHLEPTTLPSVDNWIPLETAVDDALAGNPNLLALRIALDNAEAELAVARHMLLPTLSATASLGNQGFDDEEGYPAAVNQFTAFELPTFYVGGNFSMPLGNRSAKADVMRQEAQLMQAEIDLRVAEDAVRQQAAQQVRTLENAQRRLDLAQLNLRLAEETLDAEKALQEAGRAIQKDVLEAQRSRDQAEVDLIQARSDVRKAQVQLLALQGRL